MANPLDNQELTSLDFSSLSDIRLISLTQEGNQDAYAELFRRHRDAGLAIAKGWARTKNEAEDLLSTAFTNILAAMQTGAGPTSMFRAYLYSTIRNAAHATASIEKAYVDVDEWHETVSTSTESESQLPPEERELVREAFKGLPPEDKEILWYIEVENITVVKTADILNLSRPQAYRALRAAKEHLREEYLRVHISTSAQRSQECQRTSQLLPRYIRGIMRVSTKHQVANHIHTCASCTAAVAELRQVNRGIHGVIAPILLGSGTIAELGWGSARPAHATQTKTGVARRILDRARWVSGPSLRPVVLMIIGAAAFIGLSIAGTHAINSGDASPIFAASPDSTQRTSEDSAEKLTTSQTENHIPDKGQDIKTATPPDEGNTSSNDESNSSDTNDSAPDPPTETAPDEGAIAFLDTDASTLQDGSGFAVIRFQNPTDHPLAEVTVTVTIDSRATLLPPGSFQSENARYTSASKNVLNTTVGTLAPNASGQLRIAFKAPNTDTALSVTIHSVADDVGEQRSEVSLITR